MFTVLIAAIVLVVGIMIGAASWFAAAAYCESQRHRQRLEGAPHSALLGRSLA